jgi:hypothetical protein
MDISTATRIFIAALRVTGRIIWWPITKLINLTIILLIPFYNILAFIVLPLIHLEGAILRVLSLPFTMKWLERIEVNHKPILLRADVPQGSKEAKCVQTLYVFLGTAGLIGCLTGAIIFAIFKFLSSSLNIDRTIVPEPRETGRTTARYRAQRRVKREEMIDHSPRTTPVVLKKVAGPRRRGLLSQAIIEEEDSDF